MTSQSQPVARPAAPPPGPTFSVVICTYNRADVLPRAVDTVTAQTCGDFELVVVDDGSTDDTRRVVAAMTDPRVRYVHQDNQGLGVARNTGVANASGSYVTFLDDDDLAMPTWLESFQGALGDDGVVACCGEILVTDDGRVLSTNLPGDLGPAYADCRGWFTPGTFAVRRDVYEAVGGFAPDLQHLHHAEFAFRLVPVCAARGWPVRTVDEALVQRHVHDPGTRRFHVGNLLSASEYILEHHGPQLARSSWLYAQYAAVAGVCAARMGDYRTARRHLRRAVRTRPRAWKHWLRLGLASVPPVGKRFWGRHGDRIAGPEAP